MKEFIKLLITKLKDAADTLLLEMGEMDFSSINFLHTLTDDEIDKIVESIASLIEETATHISLMEGAHIQNLFSMLVGDGFVPQEIDSLRYIREMEVSDERKDMMRKFVFAMHTYFLSSALLYKNNDNLIETLNKKEVIH